MRGVRTNIRINLDTFLRMHPWVAEDLAPRTLDPPAFAGQKDHEIEVLPRRFYSEEEARACSGVGRVYKDPAVLLRGELRLPEEDGFVANGGSGLRARSDQTQQPGDGPRPVEHSEVQGEVDAEWERRLAAARARLFVGGTGGADDLP